jgi:hypothetical protein
MALSESIAFAAVFGAAIHVRRFFEPLRRGGGSAARERQPVRSGDSSGRAKPMASAQASRAPTNQEMERADELRPAFVCSS